jgi:putative addiction module antidote
MAGQALATTDDKGQSLPFRGRVPVLTPVILQQEVAMIALKLTRVGNSTGVVLPKEVLSRLKVDRGDTVFLTETPDGFQITPYDEAFARQMAVAERVLHENRDVLRRLAK